ncbi:carboxymuconolactone decarboxylase family protein [Leisingera methylohalidivorans]|uniref:Carboxymuconolactone decarboxylase n=1 Tax=Leisingera methylohalidivorans DSM 14336 TaxID=999552 RepID=V9VZ26_9RHOB|nr:carboxymuconolactone decarboxylase family protein [Leisingera methylohalidivorans]AHD02152.1 carboxymuconolactone decarboxylase [Leisingera methylohalidivorans DSM 14336]
MPEFTLHTPETAPAASKATLEAVHQAWGAIPAMHATLAESPSALIGYETLWGQIAASSFSPVEQQVAYQAVNVLHGCGYCTMGHTFLSHQAGMDDATIARLRAGQAPGDDKLAALWKFTRAVTAERGEAAEAVPAFLAAGFSRANVLDVVAIIAAKVLANYTAALAGVPNEEFMSDPALAWTPSIATAAE